MNPARLIIQSKPSAASIARFYLQMVENNFLIKSRESIIARFSDFFSTPYRTTTKNEDYSTFKTLFWLGSFCVFQFEKHNRCGCPRKREPNTQGLANRIAL